MNRAGLHDHDKSIARYNPMKELVIEFLEAEEKISYSEAHVERDIWQGLVVVGLKSEK